MQVQFRLRRRQGRKNDIFRQAPFFDREQCCRLSRLGRDGKPREGASAFGGRRRNKLPGRVEGPLDDDLFGMDGSILDQILNLTAHIVIHV